MVIKPFWHISDFVLASYTFVCVQMADFVPNNRHLREVLIFFFYSNGFRRFKDGDFDVDDRLREVRPKTFEDDELEAFLDKDPCQTQEELASAWGVTRQANSKRLHALGTIQKQGTLVPYDLKPRDFERRFFACEQLLQRQKGRVFSIASWRVMKNGFITATQREESHGYCPVMLLRRRLGWIFTLRRLCCIVI